MCRLSAAARIWFGVIGLAVAIVGLGAWSLETEYGGMSAGVMESSGGIVRVYDIDEESIDAEGRPRKTLVFEGSEEEALAFDEQRRSETRSYVVPGLIVGGGALIIIGAISAPSNKRAGEPVDNIEPFDGR